MRLCYIANGKSVHTQRWTKWFAERGHEVYLITDEIAEIDNVKIYHVKGRGKKINFLIRAWETRKLVKKIKPDILHAHYVFGYGTFGAFSVFHPFIVTAWGSDVLIDAKQSFLKRCFVKYVLRKADLITCDGENSKEAMINLGTDSRKIKVIFHGVDTKKFSPKGRDGDIIKDLFGKDSLTVISIRSLEPIYDVETLIKSIPLILKKAQDTKFIIAGEGEQEDYLKSLAKSLGISDSIKFVGKIPHDELPKYLSLSDVYVSTSLSDGGISISTLEAMACELAPVVTDVGDNSKWIKNEENGFIIPTKNSKILAEKIIYLLENEDIRMKFGMRNRKIIEEKQDYYKEMEKVEWLYQELLKEVKYGQF